VCWLGSLSIPLRGTIAGHYLATRPTQSKPDGWLGCTDSGRSLVGHDVFGAAQCGISHRHARIGAFYLLDRHGLDLHGLVPIAGWRDTYCGCEGSLAA